VCLHRNEELFIIFCDNKCKENKNSENLSLYVCRGDVCKRIPLELNVKDKQCEVRLEPVMTAPNGTIGIRGNIRILTINNMNYQT